MSDVSVIFLVLRPNRKLIDVMSLKLDSKNPRDEVEIRALKNWQEKDQILSVLTVIEI